MSENLDTAGELENLDTAGELEKFVAGELEHDFDLIEQWSFDKMIQMVERLQLKLHRTHCTIEDLYPYASMSRDDWQEFLLNKPSDPKSMARIFINSLETAWQECQNNLRGLLVEKAHEGHAGSIQFLLNKGDKSVNIAIQNQIVVPEKVRDLLEGMG